jgi:Eco57I restriction-modification methylase
MLPGYSGRLIAESFLGTEIETRTPQFLKAQAEVARKRLAGLRQASQWLGPASSIQALLEAATEPLLETLGFQRPTTITRLTTALVATIRAGQQPVVLVLTPWGERLDASWRLAVTEAIRRSAKWCLLFNGTHIRIVDADQLHSRRFLEFDLDLALDNAQVFAAFWGVVHASTFSPEANGETRLQAIVHASQRYSASVSQSLREGVIEASGAVVAALLGSLERRTAACSVNDAFEQALTIVYRVLFLLFAEARGLVPIWHPVYRDSYSLESLRTAAERPETAAGLWGALRAIARLAHAGCRAGDLRVTPFNGRLFSPVRTPLAERRDLDDQAARRALLALSTRPSADRVGLERIAYRDLGVEQLGAVYETLLDYEPRLSSRGVERRSSRSAVVELVRGSGTRKATGSFYTPLPIADYLIRRTLGPLVKDVEPERILQLRVVDPAMGSGAFLVAACRYLADAYEAAMLRRGGCHPGDFGERERVAIRRMVAERCLYGVDVNPMAVQLARLSLWLATLASDRPLTFLDHHLQAGDSLLGAWISGLRQPPTRRSTHAMNPAATLPLFKDDLVSDAMRAALPIRFSLEATPDDTVDNVRMKERALASLIRPDTPLSVWKRIADIWCASWFDSPVQKVPASAFNALADALLKGTGALPHKTADHYFQAAAAISRSRHFFHWELEFPEVFFGPNGERLANGGFDATIGNPPWDMIRADAGSADDRASSRTAVSHFLKFTRDAGVYAARSDGHTNRYQLFVERSIALTRRSGRIGLVLPGGLATDHSSALLRKKLLTECDVDAIVGFENHRGIFPIHRSVRFLLLTAARGSPTRTISCRLGEDEPARLEPLDEEPADQSSWFTVRLSPELLARVSGDDLAIPQLRHPLDLTILERAVTLFPPLGSDAGWGIRFGRELNATDDRRHFQPRTAGVPVLEGKHIGPFRTDLGSARYSVARKDIRQLLPTAPYNRPRLAYRDVASATNRLTLIAAILPKGCVSTHTLFCLRTSLPFRAQHFLCGLFNSFVLNYLVRLRVTTHVTTAIVERLPVPPLNEVPGAFRELSTLARLLSRRDDPAVAARLQATVAALYQLTVAEFEYVLGTFPLVDRREREAALRVFATEARSSLR